jgi:hypothetical protein
MPLTDHSHPIWKIGMMLSLAAVLVAINYFNANQYDYDDIKRTVEGVGVVGAGLTWWFRQENKARRTYRCSACSRTEDENNG